MVFLATSDTTHNQAFNVTNGDLYRWCQFWPRLAAAYGIKSGQVRTLDLALWMADKQPVWERLVKRHGLQKKPLSEIADWAFGNFLLRQGQDTISSMTKIRLAGFNDTIDSERMYLDQLAMYRKAGILP